MDVTETYRIVIAYTETEMHIITQTDVFLAISPMLSEYHLACNFTKEVSGEFDKLSKLYLPISVVILCCPMWLHGK